MTKEEENAAESSPNIDLIVAVDNAGGIGINGEIPWRLEEEWRHFLKLATRASNNRFVCWILGRKSWIQHKQPSGLFEQMDQQGHRILKIILSRTYSGELDQYSQVASNWDKVLECATALSKEFDIESFWNLGGPQIYMSQLESNRLENCRLFLTRINHEFQCDKFFPDLAGFGLPLCSRNNGLDGNKVTFKLVADHDEDVDDTMKFEENDISWTYHVYKFNK